MYVVPRADGETLIGATVEDVGFRKEVTLEGLEELFRLAAVWCLGLWATGGTFLGGSATGLPRWAATRRAGGGTSGIFLAIGHYRNGILLGPMTGVLVKQLLVDRLPSPHLELLRPDRFPLHSEAGEA